MWQEGDTETHTDGQTLLREIVKMQQMGKTNEDLCFIAPCPRLCHLLWWQEGTDHKMLSEIIICWASLLHIEDAARGEHRKRHWIHKVIKCWCFTQKTAQCTKRLQGFWYSLVQAGYMGTTSATLRRGMGRNKHIQKEETALRTETFPLTGDRRLRGCSALWWCNQGSGCRASCTSLKASSPCRIGCAGSQRGRWRAA